MSDLSMAGFLWWVRMQTQRGVGWEKMDYSWGGEVVEFTDSNVSSAVF